VLAWLLSLFRRGRRAEVSPIREEEAYARSYGERSGEIVSVARLEEPEPEPEPIPQPIPRRNGDISGELLRRAFEARLDSRGKTRT
jgi:hypothetical protein